MFMDAPPAGMVTVGEKEMSSFPEAPSIPIETMVSAVRELSRTTVSDVLPSPSDTCTQVA